jgi:O-antigen/teichoic acid export membrane protein
LAHLGWLDLGFSRASAKFVAQELARGQAEQAAVWAWTAAYTQTFLGLCGGALLWIFTPILVDLLHIHAGNRELVILTLRLFAFSFPLDLAARSMTGVLQATQRFGWINAFNVFGALWTYAFYAIGIFLKSNFLVVVYGLFALRIINVLAVCWASTRALPALKSFPHRGAFSKNYRANAWEMFRFGSWVSVSSAIGPLILYFDRWMVSALRGVASLPFYGVPFSLLSRLGIFPSSMTTPLFPAFSAMSMKNEWGKIEDYFIRCHRFLLVALLPILFILFVWAGELFRLWIGEGFAMQATTPFRVLILGFGIGLMAPISGALLEGIGRPDLLAKVYLVELPVNVLLVWLLVRQFGMTGAAISYALRTVLETFTFWILLSKISPISLTRWLGIAFSRTGLVGLCLGLSAWALNDAQVDNPIAITGTLIILVGYGVVVPMFLLNSRDRTFLMGLFKGGFSQEEADRRDRRV